MTYRHIPHRPNYWAGDDGSIWSFFKGKARKRKLSLLPNGRYYVCFTGNKSEQVSRLVLAAFIGPCPDGMQCCHGAGGARDNRPCNLRWGTHEENAADMIRFKEMKDTQGEGNHRAKLTADLVHEIISLIKDGKSLAEIARSFGVGINAIHKIAHGFTWSHVTGIGYKPTQHSRKKRSRK